jgi:hypothetical protein
MSTSSASRDGSPPTATATDLTALITAVNGVDGSESDAVLIDQITQLERLKSACAAAQARLTHCFTASQTADGIARKMTPDLIRHSIAGQIALARRDSRYHGSRHLGAAHALLTEMPHTLHAMAVGDLSERRAHLVIEQFGCLNSADRRQADAVLAPAMAGLSNRTAQSRAAAIAYQLDPEAVMGNVRGAVKDRNVTLRPAPDTMSRLSALLPVAQGVAVWAALVAAANQAGAVGDPRGRGQVMADHLVSRMTGERLTGCDPYGVPRYVSEHDGRVPPTTEPPRPRIPSDSPPRGGRGGLNINLIMTDRTLFGDDDAPAHLQGHGPIPAALARALVIGQAHQTTRTWIRRLYTDPRTGQLAAMDSRRRLFPASAKEFLISRDQTCRTPWCDAPIRHLDHVTPYAHGGPTTTDNGQGLCEACNHTKQAPHWRTTVTSDGTVYTRTPTGHTYPSHPPPPPRSPSWQTISFFESRLVDVFLDVA